MREDTHAAPEMADIVASSDPLPRRSEQALAVLALTQDVPVRIVGVRDRVATGRSARAHGAGARGAGADRGGFLEQAAQGRPR
jgi:hypothetical protein